MVPDLTLIIDKIKCALWGHVDPPGWVDMRGRCWRCNAKIGVRR